MTAFFYGETGKPAGALFTIAYGGVTNGWANAGIISMFANVAFVVPEGWQYRVVKNAINGGEVDLETWQETQL